MPHAPPLNSAGASASSATAVGEELNEDNVFWTGDFTTDSAQHNHQPLSSTPLSSCISSNPWHHHHKALPVCPSGSFSVLAPLPEISYMYLCGWMLSRCGRYIILMIRIEFQNQDKSYIGPIKYLGYLWQCKAKGLH